MGCNESTNNAVQALTPEELNGDEDETGSKLDGRGDSAVSKGTTDSGVVMENREIPVLPGAVPRKLPPLTCVREIEADRVTRDDLRPKSSEILEELLNQGIIPLGQTRERANGAGEAYTIMLGDMDSVRRRPPARLESLKANKTKNLPCGEEIKEKIRLAEERRKLREDELKTRLRSKSARFRAPTSRAEEDEDASFVPVEPLQSPLTLDPQDPPLHSQIAHGEAEGGEYVREAGGDGKECNVEMSRADRRQEVGESGDNRGAERVCEESHEKEEEEEENQVEELREDQLLTALEELENDDDKHK